jgi:hypothetical protein
VKRLSALALAVAVVLGAAGSVHARGAGGFRGGHHHHVHGGGRGHAIVGFGPSFYYAPPWGPYWYGYPPPVVDEPPVAPPATWYYCTSARAYYPTVATCAEPWVPVPARD